MLPPISVTVKTHERKAEVRLIHSSCGLSWAGYSGLVHRILTKCIPLASCLAVDSRSLVQYVGKHRVASGATLSDWDVKDLYTQGKHGCLIELVCKIMKDEMEKHLVRNWFWLVLSNQFTSGSECVYHVTADSGMCQIHSGIVADLVLSLVESSVQ